MSEESRKDPVTTEMLIDLCTKFKDSNDLIIIRDVTMILLCFEVFLRYDEILFIDILYVIIINTTDVRKTTQEIYVIFIIVIISTHSLFLLNWSNFLYLRRSFILFLFAIVFHRSYYADAIL